MPKTLRPSLSITSVPSVIPPEIVPNYNVLPSFEYQPFSFISFSSLFSGLTVIVVHGFRCKAPIGNDTRFSSI